MPKKKIIHISRLFWPHIGGVELHVEKLSLKLIEMGYSVAVVTEQYDPELKLKESYKGITIYRIPYSVLKRKSLVWRVMAHNQPMFNKADVVHVHDVFWWYLPVRLSLSKKHVFTTFHGYEGSREPSRRAIWHRKIVEKMSSKTICIGEFMRTWYKAKPDMVLYGAADMVPTPPPNRRLAVYLGRLEEDAGVLTYLSAIASIKPEIFLDIYGEGQQLEQAREIIKRHNLPASLHGWTKQPEERLKEARYAFVSRYLAILEAMQARRLVAAVYNNDIKRDYLACHPQSANMIIAGNGRELAQKIMRLSEAKELHMVESAYQWAKLQTWDKIAEDYLHLWQMK